MNNPKTKGLPIINSTNEFHLLRHFKFVDDSYKETLTGQLYWYYDYNQKKFVPSKISQIDIENAIKTISSKFDKNITDIETPRKLLEIIQQKFQELLLNNKIYWIDNLENKVATFIFDYKFPVGRINCLPIKNMPEKDKKRIERVSRSNCIGENMIIVNTISGSEIKLFSTKTISVEVVETKQLPFYTITAFPDCSIPDNLSEDKLVFVV